MPYLEHFDDESRDVLISLPYRTGLWMSAADDSGGSEAREAELKAIESLVTGFVEDFCKSEFVEELVRQTLARKADWSQWHEGLDVLPEECAWAVDLLSARLSVKEMLSFKQSIMEIATAVATAYREIDIENQKLAAGLKLKIFYNLKCFQAKLAKRTPPSFSEFVNISGMEQAALKKLSAALRIDHADGLRKDAGGEDAA